MHSLRIFTVFLGLIFAQDCYAYIDPASGSMLLQIVAAAVVGALLTLKGWWGSFKSLFVRGNQSTDSDSGNDDVKS